MTDLYDLAPPDGVEVLIQWLKDLAETRDARPAGAVLPYVMVHRIGGGDDGLVDKGLYSIQIFAATKPEAQALSMRVHRRMRLLAGPFNGQAKVTISTGDVFVDNVVVVEGPREMEYVDDAIPKTIYRYVATYRVELRFVKV